MLSVKVSTKHQIVVPSAIRARLGIAAGDRLEVVVTGETIVMRKRPTRPSDRLRGIGAGKGWYEPDPDTYLRRLRDELEANLDDREEMVRRDAGEDPRSDRP